MSRHGLVCRVCGSDEVCGCSERYREDGRGLSVTSDQVCRLKMLIAWLRAPTRKAPWVVDERWDHDTADVLEITLDKARCIGEHHVYYCNDR